MIRVWIGRVLVLLLALIQTAYAMRTTLSQDTREQTPHAGQEKSGAG
jgi:hypothetical protein